MLLRVPDSRPRASCSISLASLNSFILLPIRIRKDLGKTIQLSITGTIEAIIKSRINNLCLYINAKIKVVKDKKKAHIIK